MAKTSTAKPSYLGLLNAVSLAETAAHEYLEAWIAVTPSDEVRAVLQLRVGPRGRARQGVREAHQRARLHPAAQGRPEAQRARARSPAPR